MLLDDVRALYLGTQRQAEVRLGADLLWLGEDWADDINTSLWTPLDVGTTVSGGRLHTVPNGNWSNAVDSVFTFDLTDRYLAVEVVSAGTVATGNPFVAAYRDGPNNDSVVWEVWDGNLQADARVAGSQTTPHVGAYDPVAHRWWRLAAPDGVVRWETSPDGVTWTQRGTTWTPPWAMSDLTVLIGTGQTGADAIFGDVRIGVV